MTISMSEKMSWSRFCLKMGLAVRSAVRRKISRSMDGMADAVAEGGGDVIYRIDRVAEDAMREVIAEELKNVPPFVLIAEGFEGGHAVFGDGPPAVNLLADPIDGTRGIMYDKRSAFFLASVAPAKGESTSLLDTIVSVVVEIPTSKQGWADQFVAVQGKPLASKRVRLDRKGSRGILIRPSTAQDLNDGFGHVTDFFPGTKVLAAELMERISIAMAGPVEPGRAKIFNDQYVSTAGQQVELMLHDRFCCDLRPLFFQIMQKRGIRIAHGLCCHPYDCAGALVAQQAGVILTDGFGEPLNPFYNVHDSVHWCGYANSDLRARIEPVIQAFLAEHGVSRSTSS